MFLSGENNFRYSIFNEYKANRTAPKPRHLKDLKNYLVEKYQAKVADGWEADDELGIAQCAAEPNSTIICSIDKDLRQIPGWHYSFEISGRSSLGKQWVRPAEKVYVNEFDGIKHFYYQMLVGDAADNVAGAKGIGPKKAEKILADCTTEQEMFEAVKDYFSSDEELLMTGQCLWIFRKPNDRWKLPDFPSFRESLE